MVWIDPEEANRAEPTPVSAQPGEIRIAEISSPDTLNLYSLVLSAADITHRIRIHSNTRMEIFVTHSLQEKALHEITAYALENEDRPELEKKEVTFAPTFRAMAPLLIGGLVLMYGVTGDWQPQSSWFVKGAGDSSAILQDFQFYRLVTPLTLF